MKEDNNTLLVFYTKYFHHIFGQHTSTCIVPLSMMGIVFIIRLPWQYKAFHGAGRL